jgi:hypothetical protein
MDKYSSLLRKSVNYSCKKCYSTRPPWFRLLYTRGSTIEKRLKCQHLKKSVLFFQQHRHRTAHRGACFQTRRLQSSDADKAGGRREGSRTKIVRLQAREGAGEGHRRQCRPSLAGHHHGQFSSFGRHPGTNVIKRFAAVIYKCFVISWCFWLVGSFPPKQIFVGNANILAYSKRL